MQRWQAQYHSGTFQGPQTGLGFGLVLILLTGFIAHLLFWGGRFIFTDASGIEQGLTLM